MSFLRRRYLAPWLLMMMTLALSMALPAAGQSTDDDLLQRLGSPDYPTRQQATEELLSGSAISLERMRELFRSADTPEQRQRLLNVARHHALRDLRSAVDASGDRAALGFFHEILAAHLVPGLATSAVHIINTLPGLPAHEKLRPGDLIVSLNGRPFASERGFEESMLQLQPEESVRLGVLRQGRTVQITVRTVARRALDRMYPNNAPRLSGPFREHWQTVEQLLLEDAPAVPVLHVRDESGLELQ